MIIIIDYGLGNLGSVKNALDRVGVDSLISNLPKDIENAAGLILPGVGAAGEGMKNLKARNLIPPLRVVIKQGKPLLGICLGMQLLMTKSEEDTVDCLNLLEGDVKKFVTKLKVPQIGWNTVTSAKSKLMNGISQSSYFYFVHSYYCVPESKEMCRATTNYSAPFCSIVQKKNIFGVQFHPEKSGENGLQLLKNFETIVYENNTSN